MTPEQEVINAALKLVEATDKAGRSKLAGTSSIFIFEHLNLFEENDFVIEFDTKEGDKRIKFNHKGEFLL